MSRADLESLPQTERIFDNDYNLLENRIGITTIPWVKRLKDRFPEVRNVMGHHGHFFWGMKGFCSSTKKKD